MADTSNKKAAPLSIISKGFIKLLLYLSIILGVVNLVQNWRDAAYIESVVAPLAVHAIFYFVIYRLVAKIGTFCVYNPRKKLIPEDEVLRKNQGKRLAAKVCMIVPFIWIFYAWKNVSRLMTLDTIMLGIIYYVIPLVLLSKFNKQIRTPMPSEKAVNNLRRKKNQLAGQRVWLVLNDTNYCVKEEYLDNKYRQSPDEKLADHYTYMLSPMELGKLYGRKPDTSILMQQTWRWCYVISTQDKNKLEQVYEKAYADYNDAGNPGIRKILILNIFPVSTKLQLPDKFKRTEFIYYAQVTDADKVNYKFVCSAVKDVLDTFGKGFAMATKKKKQRSIPARLLLFLRDAYTVKYQGAGRDYFEHPESLLSRILESEEVEYDFRGGDEWLMDFYSSACVFETPERSIMAMLDYWELVLRLVAIYYYKRANHENLPEEKLVHANFMELARIIRKNSAVDSVRHDKIKHKEYYVADLISGYINYMNSEIYIKFEGNQVSFLGLVSLVLTIRNKYIAHGALTQSNCPLIWGILYWATLILNNYLDIVDFQLEVKDGQYEIGYDQKISASPLIIDKEGMPCIAALQKSNKKKSYIYVNYFSGELIAPEYISG